MIEIQTEEVMMIGRSISVLIVGVVPLVHGCASITGTTVQSVSVVTKDGKGTEVAGSACELSNNKGRWFVNTPGSVTITRSNDDMQVTCKKDGSENGRAAVVSETKGSMFGNILFGGGIGAIVDHNSGAAYEYPALWEIVLGAYSKIESKKSVPAQASDSNKEQGQQSAAR